MGQKLYSYHRLGNQHPWASYDLGYHPRVPSGCQGFDSLAIYPDWNILGNRWITQDPLVFRGQPPCLNESLSLGNPSLFTWWIHGFRDFVSFMMFHVFFLPVQCCAYRLYVIIYNIYIIYIYIYTFIQYIQYNIYIYDIYIYYVLCILFIWFYMLIQWGNYQGWWGWFLLDSWDSWGSLSTVRSNEDFMGTPLGMGSRYVRIGQDVYIYIL